MESNGFNPGTSQENYSLLASGQVIYSLPGRTAFPVRLASEIFQRCISLRNATGLNNTSYTLYDPCCGSGYLLTTLAYLYWHNFARIIGSDIDSEALQIAERNFSLLSTDGINSRIAQLEQMISLYGKPSHAEALANALIFRDHISTAQAVHPLHTLSFQADVTNREELARNLNGSQVDLVITDIPYGQRVEWQTSHLEAPVPLAPVELMLASLLPHLAKDAIVVIASNKQQKFAYPNYKRLDKFQVGKRRVTLLGMA